MPRHVTRPLGLPKSGGRQKGTPNKRTGIIEELKKLGAHPLAEIFKLMPKLEPDKQMEAWIKLLAYCYPQFKSIDISAELTNNINVTQTNVGLLCKIAREAISDEFIEPDTRQLSEPDPN